MGGERKGFEGGNLQKLEKRTTLFIYVYLRGALRPSASSSKGGNFV